ncbi:MAG: hypothetical protein KGP28_02615 [Bdellovibrionales bacterium]|nr:hypothetical protein [Bdellovibrionales bacterium]
MRLRIFGIPRLSLFFAGLFPSLTWCAFHPLSLVYRREDFMWVCGLGILVALLFSTLIRRGVFLFRYFLYLLFLVEIGVALVGAVLDRDFVSLGIALLAFFGFTWIALWLERKIGSAALNPDHVWYEGDPRLIPGIKAWVREGDVCLAARVRRLDEGGFFLFLDQPFSFKPGGILGVEMSSENRNVAGDARITAHFSGEKMGLGLQFLPKDLYHFGDYSALVQELRGKGL